MSRGYTASESRVFKNDTSDTKDATRAILNGFGNLISEKYVKNLLPEERAELAREYKVANRAYDKNGPAGLKSNEDAAARSKYVADAIEEWKQKQAERDAIYDNITAQIKEGQLEPRKNFSEKELRKIAFDAHKEGDDTVRSYDASEDSRIDFQKAIDETGSEEKATRKIATFIKEMKDEYTQKAIEDAIQ